MSAASGDTVNIVMDGIGEEGGATGGPRWASPTHTPANKTTTPDEEAMRLQQAIEEGDVQLAMQWSSQLAQRKLKLNVSVDPDQDVSDEEDIQVKIYIEDKDQSVGCLTKDVKPSVTITTLKLMMLECHGFPPEIQTWIIGERLVRDDETLTKCGVKSSGACLYLYLVSAQSVGLSQEEFSRKYGHLVKPATPGLPRSLSQTSSFGTKSIPNTPGSTAVPWDQESQYMSMRNLLGDDFKQGTPPPKALTLPRSKHDVKPSTPPKPPPRLPSKPPPPVTEDENKEKYGWSCPACTYVNWPTWPGCEVCDSSVPQDYKAPDNYTLSKREQERMDREKVEEATAREQRDFDRTVNYLEMLTVEGQDLVPNGKPFDCPICFITVEAGEGVVLRECLHSCCKECLKEYVNQSNDAAMKCPCNSDFSCQAVIQDREIKALVTESVFQNYLQRSLLLAENQASNSYHCKTSDCTGWCFYDDDNNFFNCPVCKNKNCLTCKAIHEGMDCKQYQENIMIKSENDVTAKKTQQMIEALLKKGDAMKCPRCDVIVMKKDGCDWICCTMCRLEICWVTKGPRWGPKGTGDTTGGCKCKQNGKSCHPKCQNCH